MFKILRNKDKIDIELTGEVEIKTPSLPEYEEWCKQKEQAQLIKQVEDFLNKIVLAEPSGFFDSQVTIGKQIACTAIARYLVDKCK